MKLLSKFKLMFIFMLFFYGIGVLLWVLAGTIFYLLNFFIIGTSVALGIGLWPILPKEKKQIARRLSQALVGGYMFFGLGMGLIYIAFGHITPENMQLEGFWLWLLCGAFSASVIHYAIAKLLGPILINRAWCGWTCWTAAILDLLPWKKSPGRKSKSMENIRYIHLIISLGFVIVVIFVLKHSLMDNVGVVYTGGEKIHGLKQYDSIFQIPELWWFVIGNILYYAAGIVLAFVFKDNRAFCKYLCPIAPLLKIGSRIAVLKINAKADQCIDCKLCEKNCPMDIKITEYIKGKGRITSTECILCQNCANVCPKGVLSISGKLDSCRKEYLNRNQKIHPGL